MAPEGLAGLLSEPGHDIQDSRRNTGLRRQLGQGQSAQRRLFCRLEHDGVAGGQSRRELPGRDDQRVVPGHHCADHAHRLTRHQGQRVGRRGGDFPVHLVDRLPIPGKAARRVGHVDGARVADGVPGVAGLDLRQPIQVLVHQLGERQQDPSPRRRIDERPVAALKRFTRRRHGARDILHIAPRDGGQHAPVPRRYGLEGPPVGGIDEAVTDERLRPHRSE